MAASSPALAAAGSFPAPVVTVAHGCVGTWFAAADGTAPPAEFGWHGELMRAGLLAADIVAAPSAGYAAAATTIYFLVLVAVSIGWFLFTRRRDARDLAAAQQAEQAAARPTTPISSAPASLPRAQRSPA